MGNSSSKVVRKLPRSNPSWAGARTETEPEPPTTARRAESDGGVERVNPSFSRSPEAEKPSPQFLMNLSRLGQVKVPSPSATVKPPDMTVSQILHSRAVSDQQASSIRPIRNRLQASVLSVLMDERKGARTSAALDTLTEKYCIDRAVFDDLSRFVNTPSVVERITNVEVGEGKPEMVATWIQPTLSTVGKKVN